MAEKFVKLCLSPKCLVAQTSVAQMTVDSVIMMLWATTLDTKLSATDYYTEGRMNE